MSNHIEIREDLLLTYSDPYPGKPDDEKIFLACGRCGGTGYLPGYEFSDGARCWGCQTAGGKWSTVKDERRKEKARITRRNNEERKLHERQRFHNEQLAKAEEQYPILAGWHEAMSENMFLSDLWEKAFKWELSEKQIAAAARVLQANADRDARRAAEKAELTPVIEGRGPITGEVLRVEYREHQFGGDWKMLLKDDRKFKLWGTVPAAVLSDVDDPTALIGRRLSFAATVKTSADDSTFGFYSRPAKASILPQ